MVVTTDFFALVLLLAFVIVVLRGTSPARHAPVLKHLARVLAAVAVVLLAMHQLTP